MTQESMFGPARWIDDPAGSDAPLFLRKFQAEGTEPAQITICGLGFFELYLNGKKVSEDRLVPNASNYEARDLSKLGYPLYDSLGFRIYVMQYDLTPYLAPGENTLCVLVGNGYYNQKERNAEGPVAYGTPKLCYRLEIGGAALVSDAQTAVHPGFVTFNNLYDGEHQDYRLLPADASAFRPSREIPAPESDFQLQIGPPDRVIRSLTPQLIAEEADGWKLYDAGENTVGYAVFRCDTPGTEITVAYAEVLGNREHYGIHFRAGYQTDVFITDGRAREYRPFFTWHGFRYFRVKGAEPVRVDVLHADCPVTAAFKSDNETLNWLFDTFIHTQLCNMHAGVPSDCPHRERLGYTGDGQLCAAAVLQLLDCRSFYRKWLEDIADCQCRVSGHVQHTAPLMGGGGGPCGWGGAIVEVPYQYYKAYGDSAVLQEFLPRMLRYFDYLETRSENGLVCREEPGGWYLGDWCPPEPVILPEPFVNTCLYIRQMQQAQEIAALLGEPARTAHLQARIDRCRRAVEIAYFSPASGLFLGDAQGASCLAMLAGLGNEKTKRRVIEKYAALGHFDTGIIATPALVDWLFANGAGQVAFDLLTSQHTVSFAEMRRQGATTIWENWSGRSSQNHPMFGACVKSILTELLGIRQAPGTAGYSDVVISPVFVNGLDRAEGHMTTCRGKIAVSYEKHGDTAAVTVTADPGMRVRIDCCGVTAPVEGTQTFELNLD